MCCKNVNEMLVIMNKCLDDPCDCISNLESDTHLLLHGHKQTLQKPQCQILGFMITYTITKCDTIDYMTL